MIKKIKYFLILVSLVLLLFGYFRYHPTFDYKDKIPNAAETVIHVNLREIEYGLVMDFIKNPFSYTSDSKSKTKDPLRKSKPFYKCIDIPVNAFFYTNKTIFKNCFISSFFNLKDEVALKKIFEKKHYKERVYNNVKVYQKGNLFFALKENQIVCFFKTGKINVTNVVMAVFANKDYLDENTALVTKLKESKSPVAVITTKNDFVEIDLKDGFLDVKGQFSKDFDTFLPNQSASFKDSSLINMSGKLNTVFVKNNVTEVLKTKFKKLTTLSIDSIINKWNGDFSFNLASFYQEKDTIISYEYDDDFNKIEKKVIAEKTIPMLTFITKDKRNELKEYLLGKNVVKEIDGENVLAIMPLFKTVVCTKKDDLWITSGNKNIKFSKSIEKFKFFFDVHNYKKQTEGLFVVNNKYFSLIKTAQFSIDASNALKGRIDLENTSRSFLAQFVFAKKSD